MTDDSVTISRELAEQALSFIETLAMTGRWKKQREVATDFYQVFSEAIGHTDED